MPATAAADAGGTPRAALGGVPRPPRIVLAIGLPGAGKSTWFRRHRITPLSSDCLRRLLYDDASVQREPERVFRLLRRLLIERIELGRPVTYVDATNLTRRERQPFFRIARRRGCQVEALFFDTPLECCRQRNRLRRRQVPEPALERMARRLEPPTYEEGFSRIVVIRPRVRKTSPSEVAGIEYHKAGGSAQEWP